MASNLKPYTVILLRPEYMGGDGTDTWMETVYAESVLEAQAQARMTCALDDAYGDEPMDCVEDYAVIAVMDGIVQDIKDV